MDNDINNRLDIEKPNLPVAMSPRQVEVFELLRDLATEREKFHEWYRGAIQALYSKSSDCISQAANSIRELCDKLPDRIANVPKFKSPIQPIQSLQNGFLEVKSNSYSNGWKGEVINPSLSKLLDRLEVVFKLLNEPPRTARLKLALTSSDLQAEFMSKEYREKRDETLQRIGKFFQEVTHHRLIVDELEFRKEMELFESVLLNYLTPCTAAQQNELLSLIAGAPSSEALARVHDLISHKGANYIFFFDKLNNSEWLSPLAERGHFANLPGPEPTTDGRIVFRIHIPLFALTRLADIAPKPVTSILLNLKLPDNSRVGDQIVQCMAKIHDASCIKQLPPLIEQLSENAARTSWLWIQELLKSWMELDVYPEILLLLRAYLNSTVEKSQNRESDDWLTKQIDENFLEKFSAHYPYEIAKMVFQALCKWVKLEREKYDGSEIGDEGPISYFVEDFKSEPPGHRGAEAFLARRLFLAADIIYRNGNPAMIGQLDQLLRSNSWQLFRRLRCQLYADYPSLTLAQAHAEVIQRINCLGQIDYNEGSHDYEFAQLLVVHAKQHGNAFLSPNEVEQFVVAIFKGPIDKDGNRLGGNNDFFYRKQLWPIASLLQGEHLANYRILVPDDSTIKIESFKPFTSGGVSGGSVISVVPKEAKTFEFMKDEELWKFLNTWEGNEGYQEGSEGKLYHEDIFAVASEFVRLVEKFPKRFEPASKWWENITRSEIINKLLDHASDRISKKQNNDKLQMPSPVDSEWENWFGVTRWSLRQPWPRYSISRFLGSVVKSDCAVSDRFFSDFPKWLRQLIEEYDPRLLERKSPSFDGLTVAINSTRGEAIQTLLQLALRQKNLGKEIEPWIFPLIRSRLELPEESLAIFSLLGANLRLLIHLFRQEFLNNPDLLFPPDRQELRLAAVIGHFKYDQPWNLTILTFPKLINVALDTLEIVEFDANEDEAKKNNRDFASRLGTHICCYYWSGSFTSDSEGDAALDRFFKLASSETRAILISQIALMWEKHTAQVNDEQVIPRVMQIWERRAAHIEKKLKENNALLSEYEREIAESIDWLDCECFPFDWRLKYAKAALEKLKKAPRAYGLLKTIAKFGAVPDRLEATLELFQALLKRPSDELRWTIQPKEIMPMISLGLASENENTRKLARSCKDLLLRIGFSELLNVEK